MRASAGSRRTVLLAALVPVLVVAGCSSAGPARVAEDPTPAAAPEAETSEEVEAGVAHEDAVADQVEDPDADEAAVADEPVEATPTDAELPAAEELVAATAAEAPRWTDVADAEAAGYRSIGDAITGHEHLVHPGHHADGVVLDPTRPESLVYRVDGDERTYVSAMYILPPGSTMADVPDLGDERAVWHLHDELCFDAEGRVAGFLRKGECWPGGEHRVTPPMLHVWVVDHPCGPFAGIEGHGRGCDHQH